MRYPFVVTLATSDVSDSRQYINFRGGVASTLLDHEWKVPQSFIGVVALSIELHRDDSPAQSSDLRLALSGEFYAKPENLVLLKLQPTLQPTTATVLELTSTRGYRYYALLGALGDTDAVPPHGVVLMRHLPTRAFVLVFGVHDEAYMALATLAARIHAQRRGGRALEGAVGEGAGSGTSPTRMVHALRIHSERLSDDIAALLAGSPSSSADTSAVSTTSDTSHQSAFAVERQYLGGLRFARPSLETVRRAKEVEEALTRRLGESTSDELLDDLYATIGASVELQCFILAQMLNVAPTSELERMAEEALERLYCSPDSVFALLAVAYAAIAQVRRENFAEAALLAASTCSMAHGVPSTSTADHAIFAATLGSMCAILHSTSTATELVAPALQRCIVLFNAAPCETWFIPPSLVGLIQTVMTSESDYEDIMAGANFTPQTFHEEFCESAMACALSLVHC